MIRLLSFTYLEIPKKNWKRWEKIKGKTNHSPKTSKINFKVLKFYKKCNINKPMFKGKCVKNKIPMFG